MLDMSTKLSRTLGDVDSRQFTALVLPGMANGILRTNGDEEPIDQQPVLRSTSLQAVVREFHREGKIIAAICSATAVLAAAGVLAGRRFTSPIGDIDLFAGAIRERQAAVRDGNIITGLGARPYHFCDLLVEALAGEEAASGYRAHVGITR
jgi:4-methyl-5(b-hydroxyethyl)-thiazole monophosphate biosynthesis